MSFLLEKFMVVFHGKYAISLCCIYFSPLECYTDYFGSYQYNTLFLFICQFNKNLIVYIKM
nr:MAG TPA: hypothetical protein [Caudoviricetes sp.]